MSPYHKQIVEKTFHLFFRYFHDSQTSFFQLPNIDKIQAIHNLKDVCLTDKESFSYKIVSSACYDFCKFLAEICPFEGEYKGHKVNTWLNEQFNQWFANFANLQRYKTFIRSRMISCNFRKSRLRAMRRLEQKEHSMNVNTLDQVGDFEGNV